MAIAGASDADLQWSKLDDRRFDDAEHDVKLSDFEMDMSESGR